MSDPFLGQISSFGFNFPPMGWMLCQGQTLPISQYTALFSLLGTSYGGNGTTNFQLPNLQGNVPINYGTGPGLTTYSIGETAGTETVTLTLATTPPKSWQCHWSVTHRRRAALANPVKSSRTPSRPSVA